MDQYSDSLYNINNDNINVSNNSENNNNNNNNNDNIIEIRKKRKLNDETCLNIGYRYYYYSKNVRSLGS